MVNCIINNSYDASMSRIINSIYFCIPAKTSPVHIGEVPFHFYGFLNSISFLANLPIHGVTIVDAIPGHSPVPTRTRGYCFLNRAGFISTDYRCYQELQFEGVNALNRAESISTVPLKKPSIYAASQPRFCK